MIRLIAFILTLLMAFSPVMANPCAMRGHATAGAARSCCSSMSNPGSPGTADTQNHRHLPTDQRPAHTTQMLGCCCMNLTLPAPALSMIDVGPAIFMTRHIALAAPDFDFLGGIFHPPRG